MKKLLSLLTIPAIVTSMPVSLLANTTQAIKKRETDKTTSQLIRNKRENNQIYEKEVSIENLKELEIETIQHHHDELKIIIKVPIRINKKNLEEILKERPQPTNDKLEFIFPAFSTNNKIRKNIEDLTEKYGKIINQNNNRKTYKIQKSIQLEMTINYYDHSSGYRIEINPGKTFIIKIKRDSTDNLEWVKQRSQFNLVDSTKTITWTRPDLIAVDGELKIDIANTNIDKVIFDNVEQPQTNKQWNINVKPETAPKDHKLQVFFTLDGKQYTSEVMVSMLAKIESTTTPIKKQLGELIKKPDVGNILDNNDNTIFLAVNKANNNIIDDFTQIEIINKKINEATLTAKPDSKSYQGLVFIKYNVAPATVVDLKIELQPTATNGVVVDNDYLAQLDSGKMTNKVNTFYYASSESVIKMVKPTPNSVITGVVYGCDEQWNKTAQSSAIDPIKGIKLDGSQLRTVEGKYLIDLKNELNQTSTIYLQIHGEKAKKEYWNTDKGKQFEQLAEDNGYKNIRGSSASQLNKLLALSPTWKQSLKHLDLRLDSFVLENIKNVTQDEIDTYKTKLLVNIKSQVEKYVPDGVENTDYKILADNLVVGDWTSGKDVTIQAVDGSAKLLSFTNKKIPVQQKNQPTPSITTEPTSDNNKGGDSKLWIISVVVCALAGVGILYLLFRKFIFNKYILPKIYARRQQKVVEQWKRDDREEAEELAHKQAEREEKHNSKNDNDKGGDE